MKATTNQSPKEGTNQTVNQPMKLFCTVVTAFQAQEMFRLLLRLAP